MKLIPLWLVVVLISAHPASGAQRERCSRGETTLAKTSLVRVYEARVGTFACWRPSRLRYRLGDRGDRVTIGDIRDDRVAYLLTSPPNRAGLTLDLFRVATVKEQHGLYQTWPWRGASDGIEGQLGSAQLTSDGVAWIAQGNVFEPRPWEVRYAKLGRRGKFVSPPDALASSPTILPSSLGVGDRHLYWRDGETVSAREYR
jgi:hypothetical protein